jgi:hypothetical protein
MDNRKKLDGQLDVRIELNSSKSRTDELRETQTKRLLIAYEKIQSPDFREQLVLFMQIVSEKPESGQSPAFSSKYLH